MKLEWLSEDIADENGALDLVKLSEKTRIHNPALDDDEADRKKFVELPSVQKADDFVGKYSFSQALEFAEGENQKELSTLIDTKMKGKQSTVQVSVRKEEGEEE